MAQVVVGVLGGVLVVLTLESAMRTVVVPRAESVVVTRLVFMLVRGCLLPLTRLRSTLRWTDRVMALHAPIALLLLPLVWVTMVFLGFAAVFWALGEGDVATSLDLAGSSLLTLGFTKPTTGLGLAASFVGAALLLAIVVLLLVTYLPTMYAAFAERERRVTMLESRAGMPPTGRELIMRMAAIEGLGELDWLWEQWEEWFATVQESHTSQPALVFFRSQRPEQHWVPAAGALLDAAAMYVACVDHEQVRQPESIVRTTPPSGDAPRVRVPKAELCIRAGYLCLREVARSLGLEHDTDPAPDDPIAIGRDEFDDAWDELADAGVPLVDDRDGAWRAWAGWRVNYDRALLALARFTLAPSTPWTSDRAPAAR